MTPRRLAPLPLALGLVAAWPAAAAGPTDLYYERSLMSAAGARCRLFDPATTAALAAAGRQARGAALRAGTDPDTLDALQARAAERAGSVACNSHDLTLAAGRVRAGFAGFAQLNLMDFPGGLASWHADRGRTSGDGAAWRLSQPARAASGPAIFGIAAGDDRVEALTAVTGWPASLAASSARLVMRDPARAPRPYLDPRRKSLAAQVPPRAMTRAFLASGRTVAPSGLLPAGAAVGAAFRFPTAAAAALQALDPREAVLLELVYPTRDGERVEDAPIEVGDFAAGVAFLQAKR